MSLSSQIFNLAVSIVDKFGYSGVFVLMLMESATLPIPSEVVLPLAGYLVYLGQMDFWLALTVASIGSIIGTLIDYYIGFYLGRAAILHYGKYFRLNERHLVTSERWFNKFGEITVLLARFVPVIRTLVAFPAGIAEMKLWKFIAFSLVGIVIWDGALIYLGQLAGQNSTQLMDALSRVFPEIGAVAIVVSIIALVIVIRRRQKSVKQIPKPEESR